MQDDYEQVKNQLNLARNSSGSEQIILIRKILNSETLRTALFHLAIDQVPGEKVSIRRNYRNHIVWLMQESKRIWKEGKLVYGEEIYSEAEARTWAWFSQNLEKYRPDRASFVTWFNMKLKFVTKDVAREIAKGPKQFEFEANSEQDYLELIEKIPDPYQDPEFSILFRQLIDQIRLWLAKEKALICQRCVPRHPEANCHAILEKYLPRNNPDTQVVESGLTFTELAHELKIEEPILRRCYREKCLPMLKTYLEKEYGW
jgi:hypothetical protein